MTRASYSPLRLHISPSLFVSASLSWDAVAKPTEQNSERDTWNDIAIPILRTLQRIEDEADGTAPAADIDGLAARLGVGVNQIGPQLNSLAHDEYIAVRGNRPTSGRPHRHFGITLLPEGRRALGEWPASPMAALASALARALDEASAASSTPEDQSRLKGLADKARRAGAAISPALLAEAVKALLEAL